MNKQIRKYIGATLTCVALCGIQASAQYFSAGIRDSRYIYGQYDFSNGLDIRVEHSVYSEKIGFQRIGASVGYHRELGAGFSGDAEISGATTWNRNYQVVWANVGVDYNYRRIGISAAIRPIYDTGLHYTTTWRVGALVRLNSHIDVRAAYTTIPEFRMSEKRVRGGFGFNVGKLSVVPEVSVSVDHNTVFKNLRVLMSMQYKF
ncbi:MAG: porin family protein [Odoribacter sp.]|nr:porin family protein [Odoribacter sp.]